MKILALDSSGLVASAAVVEDDVLIAEYTTDYKKTHSQTLLPMLDEIRQMIDLDLHTIDAIAISAGPGSFTGLRIGAATAKGLGLALNLPLVEVPTLEGLAFECEKAGHPDMVFEFCSTSKVSFAGSGIAAIASSKANLDDMRKSMTIQTIGYDKINQLRHVRYFKDINGIREHMKKHAAIMRPKFEAVLKVLDEELGGLGIGSWTKPNGGYFISFDAMDGCAKAIAAKCKEAGVTLTGAGATFPYKKDPKDSNIRIAPSFPTPEEMAMATDLFVLCVKMVSVDKLLENK